MPQLTAGLGGIAASYAKGGQMMVSVPVDADTRRATITIYDYNSTLQLGSSALEVSPSSTATIPILAGNAGSAPTGTYYISVELCSTSLCTTPLQKNLHERKAAGATVYTETRTITGMGVVETCSTGIPIQTFQIQ